MKNKRKIDGGLKGFKFLFDVKRDPLIFFTNLMKEKGDYVWTSIKGRPVVMLNDATGIEHVFQNTNLDFIKGHFQQFMRPLAYNSVLLHEGYEWKEHRKNAAPAFASNNYDDILANMVAAVEAMFVRWEQPIKDQRAIDIAQEMTLFAFDVLLRALFHELPGSEAIQMRGLLETLLIDIEKRIWAILQIPQSIAHSFTKYRKAKALLKKIIADLVQARTENKAYPDDLLSRSINFIGLSAAERDHLHSEVLIYLVAGHETTAHGLTWALYKLSTSPLILRKLELEVAEVLTKNPPTMQDIAHLHYTRQIFDEALRLYPPVWTISRESLRHTKIPLDDGSHLDVEAGDTVMMCAYAVHRREKYWPHPEAFDPDRFSSNPTAHSPSKAAWFPFGGGPRVCLGQRFAQIESVLALAMITNRYELSLVPGQEIKPVPNITLRPDKPVFFNIRKRAAPDVIYPREEIIHHKKPAAVCPMHIGR